MTCSAYWARQIDSRIRSRWPATVIIQARAYNRDYPIQGRFVVTGVVPDERDPIKHMISLLKKAERPQDLTLMFHPRGGVSVHLSSPQ